MCGCWLSLCPAKASPGREISSRLCFVSQGLIQTDPAQQIPSQPSGMPPAFLHSSPFPLRGRSVGQWQRWEVWEGAKKRPSDNTYKQIFLHVINKSRFWLFKYSLKGEKYFCFYSILPKSPASSMELCITTVQCLHIFFWTLQYLLVTQLLKSHSTLCDDARTLIHVLKQYFHLLWKRFSDLSRTWYFPSCQIKNEFAPAHAGFQATSWALYRKPAEFPFWGIWCSRARSCCNRGFQGHPGIKNTLVHQDFVSCAWWINSLLFSYSLVERNCEDRFTSFNSPLQKIYSHKFFLRAWRVFWRTELMQDVKNSLETEMLKCTFCLFLI